MRTHHFSIAIDVSGVSQWAVAIIMKTYRRGVLVDAELVYGPRRVQSAALQRELWDAVQRLQQLVAEDQADNPQ